MARIRTVKPDFWKDEELSEISPEAALLAIGLLNHSDDEGYFKANPKLIQAEIFPLRELSVSIHELIKELSIIDYITLLKGSDGKKYGHVNGFSAHQKINRPTASKIKALELVTDDSLNNHEQLTSGKERKGKERKGKEEGVKETESCPQPKHTEDDLITAEYIFTKILELNPDHKKPNMGKWADTIRLMRVRDKRNHREMLEMFNWANNDDFWKTNILSPTKLRDQWDKLAIQRDHNPKNGEKVMKLPAMDEQLEKWAKEHGFPGPGEGHSYPQYRSRLNRLIEERSDK